MCLQQIRVGPQISTRIAQPAPRTDVQFCPNLFTRCSHWCNAHSTHASQPHVVRRTLGRMQVHRLLLSHMVRVWFGTKTGRARSQHGAPCMMHAPWHTSVQNGPFVQKQHSCIPRRHETLQRTRDPAFEDLERKNYFIMSLQSAAAAVPCGGHAVEVRQVATMTATIMHRCRNLAQPRSSDRKSTLQSQRHKI
jgi:hypothetical protein